MKQAFEYLQSFVMLVLVFTGLTGIAYHLFREGGWMEAATGRLWGLVMDSPATALTTIAGTIVFALIWQRRSSVERQQGGTATIIFYLIIATGAYFVGHLAIRGTL